MKVRTDETGIKVAWNRDMELRTVVRQLARKRTLAAAVVAIFAYIAFGHWLVYAVAAIGLLILLAALAVVAREARKVRKHPPLDYSLIASMERPIWGEVFEHAGAPGQGASGVIGAGGPAVTRYFCTKGHPEAGPGTCASCERQRQRRTAYPLMVAEHAGPVDYVPRRYRDERPSLDGMTVGEVGWTTPWMLDRGSDGRWWLRSAGMVRPAPGGTVEMRVERRPDGYHVWAPRDREYEPAHIHEDFSLPVVKVHKAPKGSDR